MKSLKKSSIRLLANPNAVIAQFHHLPYKERVINIVDRVNRLDEATVENVLAEVMDAFQHRHIGFRDLLIEHFHETELIFGTISNYSESRKMLLGAYLTKEYSFQAAALFNPSIVPHPDQSGLKSGEQRFIMSLRATGEGHISSIIFKTGIVDKEGSVTLKDSSGLFSVLKKTLNASLETESSAYNLDSETYFDVNYDLDSLVHAALDEKVIFPSARCERMGMEDLRLLKFDNGKETIYYGTYTAYDGRSIRTMLLETNDFESFRVRTLYGNAINDKGMALFPEKIGGKFVMCSRQGSEKLSIMLSDDLYRWEEYKLLLEAEFPWEFVQIGNCGSPVKTDKGWLLITHGVGPMRKYVISSILLDLNDPSRIIGRLHEPFLIANESEREGYVPNVVYTCGILKHNNLLIIPYGISNAATIFASVEI